MKSQYWLCCVVRRVRVWQGVVIPEGYEQAKQGAVEGAGRMRESTSLADSRKALVSGV